MPRVAAMSRTRDPDSQNGKLRAFLPQVYGKYGALNARQYAYRAEAAGLLLSAKKSFPAVGGILTELRDEGILPWSAVLDSVRECYGLAFTDSPEDTLDEFRRSLDGIEVVDC